MVFSHTSTRISHRYTHASSSSHLSMLSHSPSLSSLNHTANSHWLSILHMVMYVAMLLSPYIPPSPSTPPPLALGLFSVWFSSVQFSSPVMSDSLRPHGLHHARPPCFITNSQSSLRLMSIESVLPSNHLIPCPPLLLPPSIFPSIMVFSNESVLRIRWPKYWSFSFNISPSN